MKYITSNSRTAATVYLGLAFFDAVVAVITHSAVVASYFVFFLVAGLVAANTEDGRPTQRLALGTAIAYAIFLVGLNVL